MLPLNLAAAALVVALLSDATRPAVAAKDCGVYLAPSSIPGAGMGMYAGNKDYNVGDVVTLGDLVVPVYELEWHNNHKQVHFLWDEYVWHSGNFAGMEREAEDSSLAHAASTGMGAAVNCMIPLVNVEDALDSFNVSMSGVKSNDPGAGAFTPYHNRVFKASRKIPAGVELFASYGESYFTSRSYIYGYLPMEENYKEADKIIKTFKKLVKDLVAHFGKSKSAEIAIDIWEFLADQPTVWDKKSRTLNALPEKMEQIDPIMRTGGTSQAFYNHTFRDIKWLEENGKCMDNIKDGISTLPSAGRGAFANRFIGNGDIVAPAPLIQITNGRILTMHDSFPMKDDRLSPNMDSPNHSQLMLNYCFGHKESTMLLCPYGLLVWAFNHSKEKTNAKVVWSSEMRHMEWREKPISEFEKVDHSGLSFDIVATRDIQEDEEIFLDYGDEWEEAWNEHVRNFDTKRREHYAPAYELNKDPDLVIRTFDEPGTYESDGVIVFVQMHFLKTYGIKTEFQSDDDNQERTGKFCKVISRSADNLYTVQILSRTDNEKQERTDETVLGIVWGLPRNAIYFEDEFYQRDHHKVWSFRHPMMIPDEIFPKVWKNRAEVEQQEKTAKEARAKAKAEKEEAAKKEAANES